MAISWDWEFNAGTILPIVASFAGVLWRLHNWDVKTNVRHEQNTAKFESLESSHEEIKHDIQALASTERDHRDELKRDIQAVGDTQKECQKKITETREMVIRLDEANKQRS